MGYPWLYMPATHVKEQLGHELTFSLATRSKKRRKQLEWQLQSFLRSTQTLEKGTAKSIALHVNAKKIFQEVGYNLPLCFLIIFPEVSTLASLVVVNLLKVKIYFLSICHMKNARLCNFKDCSLSSVFWKWTSLVSLGNAICKT